MDPKKNNIIYDTISFISSQCEISPREVIAINNTALILGGFKRFAGECIELAVNKQRLILIDNLVPGVWFEYYTRTGKKIKAYDVTRIPVIFTAVEDICNLKVTDNDNYHYATFDCALENMLLINCYNIENDYWMETLIHFNDFIKSLNIFEQVVTKEHFDFARKCMNFDHYYMYSDDVCVYRAGVTLEKEIKRKIFQEPIYKHIHAKYFKSPHSTLALI